MSPVKENTNEQISLKPSRKTKRLTCFIKNNYVLIIDIIIALALFGLGIGFRYWLHNWFETNIGRIFHLTINEDNPSSKIGHFLGVPPKTELPWEGYFDWTYYYVPYIENFLAGWNPYSGSKTPGDPLGGYVYGPFYIYFISIPAWLFDVNALESAMWSNIVFDAGVISLVYLIARTKEGIFTSLFAALLYFFSPVVLFYSVIRVLNMPQVTFFVMLYFYLIVTDHDDTALISLIIAILTKQVALFLIGPAVVYWYKKYGPLKGTSFPLLSIIYMIIGSYPWLAISFTSYIGRIFAPGRGKSTLRLPKGGESVTLAESFLYLDYPNFAENVRIVLNSFANLGLMLIISAITGWLIFFSYEKLRKDLAFHSQIYAFFIIGAHAVMARGIYKYYDPIFIPFLILSLIVTSPGKQENKKSYGKTPTLEIPQKRANSSKNIDAEYLKNYLLHKVKTYYSTGKYKLDAVVFLKNLSVLGIFFFLNERILDINRYLHPLLLFTYTIMILLLIDNRVWKTSFEEAKEFLFTVSKNTYYLFKGIVKSFGRTPNKNKANTSP